MNVFTRKSLLAMVALPMLAASGCQVPYFSELYKPGERPGVYADRQAPAPSEEVSQITSTPSNSIEQAMEQEIANRKNPNADLDILPTPVAQTPASSEVAPNTQVVDLTQEVVTPAAAPVDKAVTPVVEVKVPSECHGLYRIQAGDTTASIAQKCLVSEVELVKKNRIGEESLVVGQTLSLPFKRIGSPASVSAEHVPSSPQQANLQPQDITPVAKPIVMKPIVEAKKTELPKVEVPKKVIPASPVLNNPEAAQAAEESFAQPKSVSDWAWPMDTKYAYLLVKDDDSQINTIEIYGDKGAPVKAVADGTVAFAGDGLREYGLMLMIKHENGRVSIYAHNQQLNVKEGDQVKLGQTIALMGDTGLTHRPKLYLEAREEGRKIDIVPLFEPLP